MRPHPLSVVPVPFLLLATVLVAPPPVSANIYTWIDDKGVVNVSNMAPPEGTKLVNNTPDLPGDPGRDAAIREAARQAQVQALADQVQQLQRDLDQSRRDVAAAATPAPYPPASVIVYVAPQPSVNVEIPVQGAQPVSGCDFGFNCGLWPGYGFYPGYVVANPPPLRHRRGSGFGYPPLFGTPIAGMPPSIGGQPPPNRPPPVHARAAAM